VPAAVEAIVLYLRTVPLAEAQIVMAILNGIMTRREAEGQGPYGHHDQP
jgi:hypothetical protein